MKLKSPPYKDFLLKFEKNDPETFSEAEKALFISIWSESWPAYRQVIEQLFSDYHEKNLFKNKKIKVSVCKLIPKKRINYRAHILIRFSFDETGITWDIFQKGNAIVHAQPVF